MGKTNWQILEVKLPSYWYVILGACQSLGTDCTGWRAAVPYQDKAAWETDTDATRQGISSCKEEKLTENMRVHLERGKTMTI